MSRSNLEIFEKIRFFSKFCPVIMKFGNSLQNDAVWSLEILKWPWRRLKVIGCRSSKTAFLHWQAHNSSWTKYLNAVLLHLRGFTSNSNLVSFFFFEVLGLCPIVTDAQFHNRYMCSWQGLLTTLLLAVFVESSPNLADACAVMNCWDC